MAGIPVPRVLGRIARRLQRDAKAAQDRGTPGPATRILTDPQALCFIDFNAAGRTPYRCSRYENVRRLIFRYWAARVWFP